MSAKPIRSEVVAVTVDGREVRVPRSWLNGFCRPGGSLPPLSVEEGARWYAENAAGRSTQTGGAQ